MKEQQDTVQHQSLTFKDIALTFSKEEISGIQSEEKENDEVIGQPRALKALQMGTHIRSRGYNIFVSGLAGTGRKTAIKKVLKGYKPPKGHLKDIAVVYNFKRPENPKVLYFSPGGAMKFKKALHQTVENLKNQLKRRLESENYQKQRDKLLAQLEQDENHQFTSFEQEIRKDGFAVIRIHEEGQEEDVTDIFPVIEDEPVPFEELQPLLTSGEITEEDWSRIREQYYTYMTRLESIFKEVRRMRQKKEEELGVLQESLIRPTIEQEIADLASEHAEKPIQAYLKDVQQDMVEHHYLFIQEDQEDEESSHPAFIRYGVNVIEDNTHTQNFPLIFETYPTYKNLFGTIEARFDMSGESRTSFMMIRAGSLIKASGGFLILNAEDLIQNEEIWTQLKRVLETGKVEIQHESGPFNLPGTTLKPEPVIVDTKVILLGTENLYELLYNHDADFQKYFKVSAEFDHTMDRTGEAMQKYTSFIHAIIKKHNLKAIDESGIKKTLRFAIRLAEQNDRLTTRFSAISDLLQEANYWADQQQSDTITGKIIEQTMQERRFLSNLPEEKLNEMIISGDLLIDVAGNNTGIVNGLAVHDRGYYAFGSPCRISARIAPGDDGIINIEREVGLSGEIHDKWVLILHSFLRSRYARNFPISMSASICFEQSYSEVEGDSAASTELYALLSAIADLPLRQDLAVTGSVNQNGQIQPVGGVTEKIEGFYSLCQQIGLTGTQGVIIPRQNVKNLILNNEVCEAVKNGMFSIYPVSTIDQGMEILTGLPAGIRNKKGVFPAGTINAKIEHSLKEMAEKVKNYNS